MRFTTAAEVEIPQEYFNRITTGNTALDTLLGDGLLAGSVLTLSARHGTGKTQFALALLECLSSKYSVGYLSNEESVEQLAYTCTRIRTGAVPIANCSTVGEVCEAIETLDVLVVDSFSKLQVPGVRSSLKTEKIALKRIIAAAKQHRCCVILITHNTKAGQSKGTSLVQHDVDATLYIERVEESSCRRVWFEKNRFGAPGEIHLEMTSTGYKLELVEPNVEQDAPKVTQAQRFYNATIELLTTQGTCSAADVAIALNTDVFRANNVLRELRQLGRVNKVGRGATASFELLS